MKHICVILLLSTFILDKKLYFIWTKLQTENEMEHICNLLWLAEFLLANLGLLDYQYYHYLHHSSLVRGHP